MLPLTFVQKALFVVLVASIWVSCKQPNPNFQNANSDTDLYTFLITQDSIGYNVEPKGNPISINGVSRNLPILKNHRKYYLQPNQMEKLWDSIQADSKLKDGITFCPCDSSLVKFNTGLGIDWEVVIGNPTTPSKPPGTGGEDIDYEWGGKHQLINITSYRNEMTNNFYKFIGNPANPFSKNVELIGVMDSGMDPDISERESIYFKNPDVKNYNDSCGYNFVSMNSNPVDDNGHGSAVIDIILSNIPKGTRKNHRIVPLKVLDSNNVCTTFEICCALRYATINKISTINMSLGYYAEDDFVEHFLKEYVDSGGIAFCSAGNDSTLISIEGINHYPSGYIMKNIVEVCAYGPLENLRALYSNYRLIDDGVEGVIDVGSAVSVRNPRCYFLAVGQEYRLVDGTSFAAPRTLSRYVNVNANPASFIKKINLLSTSTIIAPDASTLGP